MSRDVLFQTLIEGLMPDVYAFAYWLSGDKHTAEDLTQEALVRAWRFVGKLRDEKAVKPWLFTIVRREFYRLKRKPFQTQEVDLDDPQQYLEAQPGHIDAIDADQLDIRAGLKQLPDQYREPLVLQVLMGHSTEEIAVILGVKQGAVLTRLFRARKRLRQILESSASAVEDAPKATVTKLSGLD